MGGRGPQDGVSALRRTGSELGLPLPSEEAGEDSPPAGEGLADLTLNLCAGTLTSDPSSSTGPRHSVTAAKLRHRRSWAPSCSTEVAAASIVTSRCPLVSLGLCSLLTGAPVLPGSGACLPQDELIAPNHGYRDPISKFGPIMRS